MDIARLFKHLLTTRAAVRRSFTPAVLARIEAAIDGSERSHRGEIRFVIEHALDPDQVLRGLTARERALQVFAEQRVWDTQANSGVLLYVLYADHAIEIVADRGIHAHAGEAAWQRIAAAVERAYAAGQYEQGSLQGIADITAELQRHLPGGGGPDELPDQVTLL